MKFFITYGGITTEITNFVESYQIDFAGFDVKNLRPVTSKVQLIFNEQGRNLQSIFLQYPVIYLRIEEGGVTTFIGKLVKDYNFEWNNWHWNQKATFLDLWDVLRETKITLQNTYDNYQTALQAWWNALPTDIRNLFNVENTNDTGDVIVFDLDTPAHEVLSKITTRYGRIPYFQGNVLRTVKLATISAPLNITKIANIKKTKEAEKGYEITVKYDILKQKGTPSNLYLINKITHKDIQDYVSDCAIIVNPNSLVMGGTIEVSIPETIKQVSNVEVWGQHSGAGGGFQKLTSTTTLKLETLVVENKKIRFSVRNTTAGQIIITRLEMRGIIYETERTVVVATSVGREPRQKIELKCYGSSSENDIQNLTDLVAFLLDKAKYQIVFDTSQSLNVGQFVNITDTTTDTNGTFLVTKVEKQQNKELAKITAIPVSTYFQGQFVISQTSQTFTSNENTSNQEITNNAVNTALQNLSNPQGTNEGGWTNIPADFALNDITYQIFFNNIRLSIRKQYNLSNLEGYEIEWKYLDTATWNSLGIFAIETILVKIPFQTDANGNRLVTQVQIRVRRRTRAGLVSNWWVSPEITLDPRSGQEITVDGVTIDNNNFWFANNFKVGDTTKYIQYTPSGLDIVNAGTRLTNTDIRITENTTFSSILNRQELQFFIDPNFTNLSASFNWNGLETIDHNRGFTKNTWQTEWLEGKRVLVINRTFRIAHENNFYLPLIPLYTGGGGEARWEAWSQVTLHSNHSTPVSLVYRIKRYASGSIEVRITGVNSSLWRFPIGILNPISWGFNDNNVFFTGSGGYMNGLIAIFVSFMPSNQNVYNVAGDTPQFTFANIQNIIVYDTPPPQNHIRGINKYTRIVATEEITQSFLSSHTFQILQESWVGNFIGNQSWLLSSITNSSPALPEFLIPEFVNEKISHRITITTTNNISTLNVRQYNLDHFFFGGRGYKLFLVPNYNKNYTIMGFASSAGNLPTTWKQVWWDWGNTTNLEILNYNEFRILWDYPGAMAEVFFSGNNHNNYLLSALIHIRRTDYAGYGIKNGLSYLSYTTNLLNRFRINYTHGGTGGQFHYSWERLW